MLKWENFLFLVSLPLVLLLSIFFGISVNASDFREFYYYGGICNSYHNIGTSDVEYIMPSDVFCFVYNDTSTQYLCFAVPSSSAVVNGNVVGIIRHQLIRDMSGVITGVNYGEFVQINYGSTIQLPYDGELFYIRRMSITTGLIYGCPYFSSSLAVDDGIPAAFKSYYDGVIAFSSDGGGSGGSSGSVDLSDIENSLSAINSSNNFIANDVSSIRESLEMSLTPDNSVVESIRVYVVLCFMVLMATLFRNIFNQWVRNTVRR